MSAEENAAPESCRACLCEFVWRFLPLSRSVAKLEPECFRHNSHDMTLPCMLEWNVTTNPPWQNNPLSRPLDFLAMATAAIAREGFHYIYFPVSLAPRLAAVLASAFVARSLCMRRAGAGTAGTVSSSRSCYVPTTVRSPRAAGRAICHVRLLKLRRNSSANSNITIRASEGGK